MIISIYIHLQKILISLMKSIFTSKKVKRNYRKEYDSYHGTPKQKKLRAERNRLNRIKKKSGA